MATAEKAQAQLAWAGMQDDSAVLRLSGSWTLAADKPDLLTVWRSLADKPAQLLLQVEALDAWDSSLLAVLRRLQRLAADEQLSLAHRDLPAGVERLLQMAATPSTQVAEDAPPRLGAVSRLGLAGLRVQGALVNACTFGGAVILALGRLLQGRARMRSGDFWAALA